jgi:hypothetical protein
MGSADLDGALEASMDCEVAESWAADGLPVENEPEVLEVGREGEESLTGEVGESRSREPEESFVLFFFKNDPRVGIRAACRSAPGPGLTWEPQRRRGLAGSRRAGQGMRRQAGGSNDRVGMGGLSNWARGYGGEGVEDIEGGINEGGEARRLGAWWSGEVIAAGRSDGDRELGRKRRALCCNLRLLHQLAVSKKRAALHHHKKQWPCPDAVRRASGSVDGGAQQEHWGAVGGQWWRQC